MTRPASSFWSVSVPPASVLGLVAPVEGCWPGCRPEPSVLVAPVEGCWPGCARARPTRYALNRLPHSVSNVADRAACRRAALDRIIGAVIAVRGGTT